MVRSLAHEATVSTNGLHAWVWNAQVSRQRWTCFLPGGLSVPTLATANLVPRTRNDSGRFILLVSPGGILAAEGSTTMQCTTSSPRTPSSRRRYPAGGLVRVEEDIRHRGTRGGPMLPVEEARDAQGAGLSVARAEEAGYLRQHESRTRNLTQLMAGRVFVTPKHAGSIGSGRQRCSETARWSRLQGPATADGRDRRSWPEWGVKSKQTRPN